MNAASQSTLPECELCRHDATADIVIRTAAWRVVLVDDPAFPGFCRVIRQAHAQEMTDLTPDQQSELMGVVWAVESVMRTVMRPDKINLASLGNMVPHVHWHVIPRYRDDSHFPNPVWGQTVRATDTAVLAQRRALLPALRAAINDHFQEKP